MRMLPNKGVWLKLDLRQHVRSLLGYITVNKLNPQPTQSQISASLTSTSRTYKPMSLRKKTRLLFGIVLISLMGVVYASSSTILLGSLKKAETLDTRQVTRGVLGVLDQAASEFDSSWAGWSAWDDSYIFIQDGNQNYIQSNLIPEALASIKVNLVLYINSAGKIVFGTGFDFIHQKKTPVPPALLAHLTPQDLLLKHSSPKSSLAGIVLLPEGAMLISSRPIVTSEVSGPIRGSVIFGRLINQDQVAKLSKSTLLPITVHGVNEADMPADFQTARSLLSDKEPILIRLLSEQIIAGYTIAKDIYGKPALLIRVDVPRDIYAQGQTSLRYLMISLIVVGLVFAGVTLPLLERSLLLQYQRQEREQRYRIVVAQASEGIFLIDADTKRFLEANAAFEELLGYTSEEILGLTLYDVIADERETIERDLHNNSTKQQDFTSEWKYRCKNGSLVDVEVSANLISYEQRDVFCMIVRNISDRKRAEAALKESESRLSWQASHDPLTELFNRREFEKRLQQAVVSAKTAHQQHALLYMDLDQFKIVNDTCKHVAGDELLRQVSALFQAGLRKSDVLARLGGDEFAVLLYHCPLENALRIANILRERIHNFRFVWKEKTFHIGVSIGLVLINVNSQSADSVLSAADAACYAAKNNGRNQVHIYKSNDSELAHQYGEMQWISLIPQALQENRFQLYSQAIVPLQQSDTQVQHYEVLLRLLDEKGKIISPMAFIPAAERYHFMPLIDWWVISRIFAYLDHQYQKTNKLNQNKASWYGIKISNSSINNEQLVTFIREQFKIYSIPPSIICFEISEVVAIANLSKVWHFIKELKPLGCHFMLEDFGLGIYSLAYLKNLPIDYLKIDGNLIKDLAKDAVTAEMVTAIKRIASVMGIKTIAEFVENDAVLNKLKELNIDYAQGYGISKPSPLD